MSYLIPNQIENNQINPFIESDPSMIDSSHILPRLSSSIINNSKLESKIIDVYEENFINEIKRIGTYLKQYTYISSVKAMEQYVNPKDKKIKDLMTAPFILIPIIYLDEETDVPKNFKEIKYI